MAQRDASLKSDQAFASGDKVKSRGREYETEESVLAREQAEVDARNPDWDLASRITTAVGALERGVPAEVVRKTYGEKVFTIAMARRRARDPAHATG